MEITAEEIEELKKKGKWRICPPDPTIQVRTGYELASRYAKSPVVREGAMARMLREQGDKRILRAKRRKKKSPARNKGVTEKQRSLLVKLRVHVPKECSRAHAFSLIQKKIGQIRFAREKHEAMDEELRQRVARD